MKRSHCTQCNSLRSPWRHNRKKPAWVAVALRLHGSAAAATAVADGVETIEHGVFEEGMVDVATFVLGLEDGYRLVARNPARAFRLMLTDEAGERFAYDQADIHGQARMFTRCPAGTFQSHNVVGVLHYDGAGTLTGDYLLQVVDVQLLLDHHSCLAVSSGIALP